MQNKTLCQQTKFPQIDSLKKSSKEKKEKETDELGEWGEAPWNLNKTCPHRKQGPQNSNRKLAQDSEYCQNLAKQGCAAQRYES